MRINKILWLLGLIIFSFLIRWNSFNMPFERDEGEYAYSAFILKNGLIPYKDSFLQKPPSIIYTYYLGQLINVDALFPPRLLATIAVILTGLILFLIVKRDFGLHPALLTPFIYSLLTVFPYFMGVTANTEIFMLLPLLLSVYLITTNKSWFWAGLAAALALSYKPICLFSIIFIIIIKIIKNRGWPDVIPKLLLFALGGILAGSLILLPIIIKGGLGSFFETAVVFNLDYAKMWGISFDNVTHEMKILFGVWWILLPMLISFFILNHKQRWYYLGLLITSLLGVYQVPIGHYYLILMPWLAVAASVGLEKIIKFIISKLSFGPKLSFILSMGFIFCFFILLILPIREQFFYTPSNLNLWIYGYSNPFTEAQIVADKLAKITKTQDRVFIGGSEPEILFYSKRISMSRFVITYPLIMDTPKRAQYQQQAIKELDQNNPKAIVISQRQYSGLWDDKTPRDFIDHLNQLLTEKYSLVGGFVWDTLDGGRWYDKLDQYKFDRASLLVYRKL